MKKSSECIQYLRSHPYLSKGFKKLKPAEIEMIAKFLDQDGDKDSLTRACNRLFVDNQAKPVNWNIVGELISCGITYKFSA